MNPTMPAPGTLPPTAPVSDTLRLGFESYLAILGVDKSALKTAKLPKF